MLVSLLRCAFSWMKMRIIVWWLGVVSVAWCCCAVPLHKQDEVYLLMRTATRLALWGFAALWNARTGYIKRFKHTTRRCGELRRQDCWWWQTCCLVKCAEHQLQEYLNLHTQLRFSWLLTLAAVLSHRAKASSVRLLLIDEWIHIFLCIICFLREYFATKCTVNFEKILKCTTFRLCFVNLEIHFFPLTVKKEKKLPMAQTPNLPVM